MNYTFAKDSKVTEVAVCKLVTGELVIGMVNTSDELIHDVALIVPREVKENDETKLGFYVIPYGFPMVQGIAGETLHLSHVIKVFSPSNGFEDVASMYFKILSKEADIAKKEKSNG